METKQCSSCKKDKPLSDYYIHFQQEKVKEGSTCKVCRNASSRRYRKNHPDDRLLRLYNITQKDYNKIFDNQKGKCKICGTHQSDLDRKLAIDHDHETGEIRGLLCIKCNTSLGWYEIFKNKINIYLKLNL